MNLIKYLENEKELFIFSFEGENSVDLTLLVKSLSGLQEAYSSIVTTQIPYAKIELEIEAFNKGSFETVISSFVSNVPPIIAMGITSLPTIKMLMEIIKLKRDLKGYKPKKVLYEGEDTRLINHAGETCYHNSTITNIYLNNPSIDKELSDVFMPIYNDNTRSAIKIKNLNGNEEIIVPKSEYENMTKRIVDDAVCNDERTIENIININLLLRSPDLLGDSKWKFLLDKHMISATIEDIDFLNRVRTGKEKALYAGVKIPVSLKIEKTMDDKLEEKSRIYTILKVLGKIIEPNTNEQINF